jgi:hypothetical protein
VNREEERGGGQTVSLEKCTCCSGFGANYSQTLLIWPTYKHDAWKRRRRTAPARHTRGSILSLQPRLILSAIGDNFTLAGFFDGLPCIGSDPQSFFRLDARP